MGKKGQSLKVKVHRHKDKTKEIASLNQQLGLLDLKVVLVTADGNCFFRAVAEQLEGDEEQHARSIGKNLSHSWRMKCPLMST